MKKALVLLVILIIAATASWFLYQKLTEQSGYTDNETLATNSPFNTPGQSKEIEVFLPKIDTANIGTKFVIYGKGRVFENTINYRVSDDSDKQLYVGSFMTNAPDAGIFGYFHEEVDLTKLLKTIPSVIRLDVLELSAKDGSDLHKTSFRLNVEQNSTTVFVYFTNEKLDPHTTCEKTYSLARIVPRTNSVLKTAIEELLKGPSLSDKEASFGTAINSGVKLNSAKIENGVAYLDFDNKLQESVAGSCKVTAIRSQITATAKQFPSVKDVIISINGVTEPILQP